MDFKATAPAGSPEVFALATRIESMKFEDCFAPFQDEVDEDQRKIDDLTKQINDLQASCKNLEAAIDITKTYNLESTEALEHDVINLRDRINKLQERMKPMLVALNRKRSEMREGLMVLVGKVDEKNNVKTYSHNIND